MTGAGAAPEDGLLFDMEAPPAVSLADRFGVPPFSIWDKAQGEWQARKRRWLSLGIQSEVGRDQGLTYGTSNTFMNDAMNAVGSTTSVFDPVVCELAYRWFSNPGDVVLDPFAGGSVRGVVAGTLQRTYHGIDLRAEQVAANYAQQDIVPDVSWQPMWWEGDATRCDHVMAAAAQGTGWVPRFDLILSCPPYADLEVYSDNPADLSTMGYAEFTHAHRTAIFRASEMLLPDRFAVWVISDVRDKATGNYRGLVGDTIDAFQTAGLGLYNDIILKEPVGTARLRGANLFNRTRKLSRMHQHVLVFVKGDGKAAARRLDAVDPRWLVADEQSVADADQDAFHAEAEEPVL